MSAETDTEHRLRDLELDVAAFKGMTDERIKTLFVNLGIVVESVGSATAALNRLNTNMELERTARERAEKTACTAPNTCLKLAEIVTRHEKILNEQKGGWKAIITIGGFASAIGGVIGWAISFFTQNHQHVVK